MNRYRDAIAIQDACNISGVAHHLVRTIKDVLESPDYTGTRGLANDPAVRMIVHKLADMCQLHDLPFIEYARMYDECKALAAQPTK
jgi:hypothetical protein